MSAPNDAEQNHSMKTKQHFRKCLPNNVGVTKCRWHVTPWAKGWRHK